MQPQLLLHHLTERNRSVDVKTAEAAEDEGMVCGGVVEVMLERVK